MSKTKPTTEGGEDFFDNTFRNDVKIYGTGLRDSLKDFIRTLLDKTATEARAKAIEKAIEAIGEDAKYIAEGDLGYPEENRWVDGFNLANDEIRQRLNQLKEGK